MVNDTYLTAKEMGELYDNRPDDMKHLPFHTWMIYMERLGLMENDKFGLKLTTKGNEHASTTHQ